MAVVVGDDAQVGVESGWGVGSGMSRVGHPLRFSHPPSVPAPES